MSETSVVKKLFKTYFVMSLRMLLIFTVWCNYFLKLNRGENDLSIYFFILFMLLSIYLMLRFGFKSYIYHKLYKRLNDERKRVD